MSEERQLPQSHDAEQATLGAALLGADGSRQVGAMAADAGLKPEHFYLPRHQIMFQAMLALFDRRDPVDVLTMCEELARRGRLDDVGGTAYVHMLPDVVPAAGNFRSYADRVVELAGFRRVIEAARLLEAAAYDQDDSAIAEAQGRLLKREGPRRRLSREERQQALMDHVQRGEVRTWPWPFARLNEMTGGAWPGHFTAVVGPSQHGKSVFVDQALESFTKAGARCCAYLTEMTELERDLRSVSRGENLPLHRLQLARLRETDQRPFAHGIDNLPRFEMQKIGTLTAAELLRDIQRERWDVALVDLAIAVFGRKTEELDRNMDLFAGLATDTGTAIIGTFHLNRSAFAPGSPYPAEPTVGQIRGSGSIHDIATNVISVYLHEGRDENSEPTGDPGDQGTIRILKVKNGIKGRVPVDFRGGRAEFIEVPESEAAERAA